MARATRSIDIDVTPQRFLEVLQDYERYPEFLPEVKEIRVSAREPARVEVAYRLDARLVVFDFTLEHLPRGPRQIDWRLLRGNLMKHNAGRWTLEDLPGGGTRATYEIELELNGRLPPMLERALAERGLPAMLRNFKTRAEKLYPLP